MATKKAKKSFDDAALKAGAEEALAAVEAAGDDGAALVEAWVKAGNAAAVAEVAERASGAPRKAARRGLNVLKSRGVEVPERRKVATVADKAEEKLEAWLMAPDAAGNVMVTIGARAVAGRYRTCFVFLNDTVGIQRVQVGQMSQSQLKETFGKVLPGAKYKPVNVSVDYARSRIAAARKLHAEREIPEPLGIDSGADLIEPAPDDNIPHPFDAEGLDLSDDDAKERAAKSQLLHLLPEFRAWVPTKQAVDEMMIKVGEGLKPGEEPDREVVEKRVKEQVDAATDRYFSPERREAIVRAMKDSALSVLAREGEQKALDVVAAMKMTEKAGLITDPPHEVPFLRAFFEKAVSIMVAQGKGALRIPIPALPTEEPATQPLVVPADAVE